MDFMKPEETVLTATCNNFTKSINYYRTYTYIENVIDEDYPEYSDNTVYNIGDFVKIDALKAVYRSSADNNQGNCPFTTPEKWVYYGALNSYKMFTQDEFITDQTIGEDIIIEMDFSLCDTIALLNVEFNTLTLQVLDENNNVLYEEEILGANIGTDTYYQYFYKKYNNITRIARTNLPIRANTKLKLTFEGGVKIGTLIVGQKQSLGCTLYGTSVNVKSVSKVKVDELTQQRKIIRYGSVRNLKVEQSFKTEFINTAIKVAEGIIDKNILFIPTKEDNFTEMITFGYFTDFEVPVDNPVLVKNNVNIIGVI